VQKSYDLYLFAAHKDLICGWHSFEAVDDKAALKVADALIIRPPAELWHEITLIKRWESGSQARPRRRSPLPPNEQ
jgi:hypothetical protein